MVNYKICGTIFKWILTHTYTINKNKKNFIFNVVGLMLGVFVPRLMGKTRKRRRVLAGFKWGRK